MAGGREIYMYVIRCTDPVTIKRLSREIMDSILAADSCERTDESRGFSPGVPVSSYRES